MEKRKSERVQFFQVGTGRDIQPVWVFRKTSPGAILGLLLDIGGNGAQVLTDKSQDLAGGSYRLIAHSETVPGAAAFTLMLNARCRWSQSEGTLYIRNGLIFDEEVSVDEVQALQPGESSWLRCEMLPFSD
jgi:hypothetical protein